MLCTAGAQTAAPALCMVAAQQMWPEHAHPGSAAGLTVQLGRCPFREPLGGRGLGDGGVCSSVNKELDSHVASPPPWGSVLKMKVWS